MSTEQPQEPAAATAYTHGYSPAVLQSMARRTAEREAGFFLPYLHPGLRVLDVGCGPGTITLGLARAVAPGELVGLDIDPASVAAAEAAARDQGVTNVRFEVGRAEALPFPDASFDAVFEHTLLEHVPDPLSVLSEMRRVLRLGGCIGLRDGDWGSNIFVPTLAPELEAAFVLYERWWRQRGGDPRLGRHQRPLLRAAGFGRLETSAGAMIRLAPGELFASRLTASDFVDQVVALGWIDRPATDRWAVGFHAWNRDPDALWANLLFESVAWIV